eukprot:8214967-Heterocapsa_arctica.AAC.1
MCRDDPRYPPHLTIDLAPHGECRWLTCQCAKWYAGTVMVLTLQAHCQTSTVAASRHWTDCPWLRRMYARFPGSPVQDKASGPTSG